MKKTMMVLFAITAGCILLSGCAGMDENWKEYARIHEQHSVRSAQSVSSQVRAIQNSSLSSSRALNVSTPRFSTAAEATMYSIMQQSQNMAIKAMEIMALSQVKAQPLQMRAPMDSGTFASNALTPIINGTLGLATLGFAYGWGNKTGNTEGNMQLHAGESINYFQGNSVGKDLTNTYFRASESGIVNSGTGGSEEYPGDGPCGPNSVQDPVTGKWYVNNINGLSCDSAAGSP